MKRIFLLLSSLLYLTVGNAQSPTFFITNITKCDFIVRVAATNPGACISTFLSPAIFVPHQNAPPGQFVSTTPPPPYYWLYARVEDAYAYLPSCPPHPFPCGPSTSGIYSPLCTAGSTGLGTTSCTSIITTCNTPACPLGTIKNLTWSEDPDHNVILEIY